MGIPTPSKVMGPEKETQMGKRMKRILVDKSDDSHLTNGQWFKQAQSGDVVFPNRVAPRPSVVDGETELESSSVSEKPGDQGSLVFL